MEWNDDVYLFHMNNLTAVSNAGQWRQGTWNKRNLLIRVAFYAAKVLAATIC